MGPLGSRVLLFVLGLALLSAAVAVGGPETDTVYQYTAFEVRYDDDNLTVRNVATNETQSSFESAFVNVDEDLVCFPADTRACEVRATDIEEGRPPSDISYGYVYADGEFYRFARGEYERLPAPVALDDMASGPGSLSDSGRRALTQGAVLTDRPLAGTSQLVRYDGRFYTILNTGVRTYPNPVYTGGGGSFCASDGRGFCGEANSYRWGLWLYPAGLAVLGLAGTVVGGRGLVRRRSELRTWVTARVGPVVANVSRDE